MLHAGEYVTNAATPHPWKTAVVNPFAVGAARIPDETSYSTFVTTQTSTQVLGPTSAVDPWICGLRMRPSMSDGTELQNHSTNERPMRADSFNACIHVPDVGDTWSAVKLYSSTASSPDATVKATTYCWGKSGDPYPSTETWDVPFISKLRNDYTTKQRAITPSQTDLSLKWVAGARGYAVQQGAKCRPVAWGFRIRWAGLTNTGASQMLNPYGRVFFGITAPQSEGNLPGDVPFDQFPVYDGSRASNGVLTGGPGGTIDIPSLTNDANRGLVGCMTLEELRSKPEGIVIATGPRTASERLFVDVDWATGQDRAGTESALGERDSPYYNIFINDNAAEKETVNVVQVGSIGYAQPWFYIEGAANTKVLVDCICHWEVVPSSQAYTLPGTCKHEMSNTAVMDATANIMAAVAARPGAGAAAAAHYG